MINRSRNIKRLFCEHPEFAIKQQQNNHKVLKMGWV